MALPVAEEEGCFVLGEQAVVGLVKLNDHCQQQEDAEAGLDHLVVEEVVGSWMVYLHHQHEIEPPDNTLE